MFSHLGQLNILNQFVTVINRRIKSHHLEIFDLGELFDSSGDLSRRQKRLHNSDINLNVNNLSHYYPKRQKSNKYRKSTESSSILSLPSLFSSTTLTSDSTMTLIPNSSSKKMIPDETEIDADDEKEFRNESSHTSRHHRYHQQLSTSTQYRLDQSLTSEDDDEELLSGNHHGIMDFMDRVR